MGTMEGGSSSWRDTLTSQWQIERDFDPLPWQQWMRKEGMVLWGVCTTLYLFMIFYGPRWMESRPKYNLRGLLIVWNAALAVFSMISAWRLSIATAELITHVYTWHSLVCGPFFYDQGGYSAFWLYLFVLSKVAEYGDTVFIVLRKSKLILLHWFHHIMTFVIGFHTFAYSNPTLFISALMNVYVHSLMYSYYVLRIIGIKIPKRVSMVLTTIQIIQLMIGTYAQFYALYMFFFGKSQCELGPFAVIVGSFSYASICLLFIKFFIESYMVEKQDRELKKNK